MASSNRAQRPTRKTEFSIHFATKTAEKGWRDLQAVRLNDLVLAWEFLTTNPRAETPLSCRLKGELSEVTRNGDVHERRQLKLSATHGARIWYFVEGQSVFLEAVHTKHPNQTK